MKATFAAVAVVLLGTASAAAGTYRIDALQSTLPINYPVLRAGVAGA